MSIKSLVAEKLNQENIQNEKIKFVYSNAKENLQRIANELTELGNVRNWSYSPVIEVKEYIGANGHPNRPYLNIYIPYYNNGMKVTVNQFGDYSINNDGRWATDQLDEKIVQAFLNL